MPEGRSAAHAFNPGAAEGDGVLANFPSALRSLDFRGGKVGEIVGEIASQKIVDVVLAGVHASHECGPRDWRDGGVGRAQFTKRPLTAQLRHIGQPAFGDETFG